MWIHQFFTKEIMFFGELIEYVLLKLLESVGKKRTNEMLNEEKKLILKSYEDVIKKLGNEINPITINRYCELVLREYPEPLKRYRFLKGRLDKKTDQIIKNKLNIEG